MSDLLREQLQATLGAAYILERELVGGGMSRVFVAEEVRLRRRVVIKVLLEALAEGLSAERFEREMVLASGLQHPHIVPVLGAGSVEGLPFYTMPLVEGESLRTALFLAELSADDVLSVLRDVAEALEYAHARGVVHRDIKPENVLLVGRAALVTDFGIAKVLTNVAKDSRGTAGAALTHVGMSLGTPAYMSPEQAVGDPATDHRTDLYAWGMMAYEALAGSHPFAHKTTSQALMAAHFIETPEHLSKRCPGVAPQVAEIVMRCIEKDPHRRPAHVSELITALASAGKAPLMATARQSHATVSGASTQTSNAVDERSIVVLPFANLSADPENEYFSDGLTDELISDLSRVRALKVISRSSAMSLKGSRMGAREIGRELGVRYVLEGSVRKAGTNLRITAQLIDAATDTNRWAEKYSGVLDDVFDLQERVSREIVRALDVTLSTDEDRSLARRSIADATAYDCYLRARHELARASADSLDRATALLNRGIEIVGENSRLRATLLYVDVLRIRTAGHIDATVLDAVGEKARDILHREPDSASAHFVLGTVDFERGRLQKASSSMQSALKADPNDVDAAIWLGIIYLYAGQMEAARTTFDRLRRQDPLSPFPLGLSSVAEWMDGDFATGLPAMAKCLELSPESTIWRWHWGYLLALAGRIDEATKQAEHLQRTDPENPYSRHLLALTRAVRGDSTGARDAIAPCDNDNLDPHMTFHVAECYALVGEASRAIELMLRSVQRGFYPHAFIALHNPFIAGLRADPRFEQVARESERRWLEFVV